MRSSSFARVVMASLGVSVLITLGCDVQSHGTLTAPTPTVTVESAAVWSTPRRKAPSRTCRFRSLGRQLLRNFNRWLGLSDED